MSFSDTVTATPGIDVSAVKGTAFKDWALVCDALGEGQQSIILRKGGIAEGRQGFRFKHDAFFLFPTQFHQQAERVRPEKLAQLKSSSRPPEGGVTIRYFFALESAEWIGDWDAIARLTPFHIWREDVLRERFDYDEQPGLQCAFGRVYRLDSAWTFPDQPAFGGCRSWLTLPDDPAVARSVTPVLDDEEHAEIARKIRAALQPANPSR